MNNISTGKLKFLVSERRLTGGWEMRKEELIDTLKIYFETATFGKGLMPPKNTKLKDSNDIWRSLKFTFEEEKFQMIGPESSLTFEYDDVIGITFESVNQIGIVRLYLRNHIPIEAMTQMKTSWNHFTSTDSVMKFRWGHYEEGEWLGCRAERKKEGKPSFVFSWKPFDFTFSGDLKVLDEGEPWLGYLTEDNTKVIRNISERPKVTRTLNIELYDRKFPIVKETMTYVFNKYAETLTLYSYYKINISDFARKSR